MSKFSWESYPKSDDEFARLMAAVDDHLSQAGARPYQRPLRVGRLFWEAFGWGGLAIPPKELAGMPGFEGDVLMAKAYRWYENTYGEKIKADPAYGYAPVSLGNAVWRVRAGVIFGQVRFFIDKNLKNKGNTMSSRGAASFNVLCAVEGLPQGLVDTLSDRAIREYWSFYVSMFQGLQWREQLNHSELFLTARHDYDESTSAVLGMRFAQARWAAQQAAEKTIKGILSIAKVSYPTGGSNGHNLSHLGKLLQDHFGASITPGLLELASCSPKVRYGEETSTQEEALKANHAALGILEELQLSEKIAALVARSQ